LPDLTVHRARMTVPGRAHDPPARPWLQAGVEDALRCASQPASFAGHVVVIKRLRVRRQASGTSVELAQGIEAAWRALARSAVHYTLAREDHEAVWFDDEAETRVALIQAWLRSRDRPASWVCARLEAMLPATARTPPSLPTEVRIARAIGAPLARSSSRGQREFLHAAFTRLRAAGLATRVIGVWDESEVQALLARLTQGAVVPPVREGVGPATARTAEGKDTGHDGEAQPEGAAHWSAAHARLLGLLGADGAGATGRRQADRFDPMRNSPAARPPQADAGKASMHDSARRHVPEWIPAEGLRSAWAGLLFLPALIERSGLAAAFGAFERAEAEAAAATLLLAAADWLKIGEDDPLREVLAPLFATASPRHAQFAQALLRAARVWAVRHLRLPLRRIAHRRGRVIATSTRIDVAFPMFDADLRLRRAGIDSDPRWLPWLGLSLYFHFLGD
jgi:hypothetical protein